VHYRFGAVRALARYLVVNSKSTTTSPEVQVFLPFEYPSNIRVWFALRKFVWAFKSTMMRAADVSVVVSGAQTVFVIFIYFVLVRTESWQFPLAKYNSANIYTLFYMVIYLLIFVLAIIGGPVHRGALINKYQVSMCVALVQQHPDNYEFILIYFCSQDWFMQTIFTYMSVLHERVTLLKHHCHATVTVTHDEKNASDEKSPLLLNSKSNRNNAPQIRQAPILTMMETSLVLLKERHANFEDTRHDYYHNVIGMVATFKKLFTYVATALFSLGLWWFESQNLWAH